MKIKKNLFINFNNTKSKFFINFLNYENQKLKNILHKKMIFTN